MKRLRVAAVANRREQLRERGVRFDRRREVPAREPVEAKPRGHGEASPARGVLDIGARARLRPSARTGCGRGSRSRSSGRPGRTLRPARDPARRCPARTDRSRRAERRYPPPITRIVGGAQERSAARGLDANGKPRPVGAERIVRALRDAADVLERALARAALRIEAEAGVHVPDARDAGSSGRASARLRGRPGSWGPTASIGPREPRSSWGRGPPALFRCAGGGASARPCPTGAGPCP